MVQTCWRPPRAVFVIPPGRSDHDGYKTQGKAYEGPPLTSYQCAASQVQQYWRQAGHAQAAHLPAGPAGPGAAGRSGKPGGLAQLAVKCVSA